MTKKAIIVDLEGVILNIDYNKTFKKFLDYGITVKYDNTFKVLTEQYDAGKITTDEMYEKFCSIYCQGSILKQEQFIEAWNAMLLYVPDPNLEYLFRLKQEGNFIVLLSNINALHAANVQETYGEVFSHLFHKIFYSFETHLLKPELKSFENVIEYLREKNINKDQIVFIDDSSENIKSACRLDIASEKYPMNGSSKGVHLRSLLEGHAPLFFNAVVKSVMQATEKLAKLGETVQCNRNHKIGYAMHS